MNIYVAAIFVSKCMNPNFVTFEKLELIEDDSIGEEFSTNHL